MTASASASDRTGQDPADLPTAESPAARPSRQCRHLLPIRGGTLGCTAPAGHPTRVHYDSDFPLPDGKVAAWECRDDSRTDGVPSACQTFVGYVDTATGETVDPYASRPDAD
jgi:hypothetical protein